MRRPSGKRRTRSYLCGQQGGPVTSCLTSTSFRVYPEAKATGAWGKGAALPKRVAGKRGQFRSCEHPKLHVLSSKRNDAAPSARRRRLHPLCDRRVASRLRPRSQSFRVLSRGSRNERMPSWKGSAHTDSCGTQAVTVRRLWHPKAPVLSSEARNDAATTGRGARVHGLRGPQG